MSPEQTTEKQTCVCCSRSGVVKQIEKDLSYDCMLSDEHAVYTVTKAAQCANCRGRGYVVRFKNQ